MFKVNNVDVFDAYGFIVGGSNSLQATNFTAANFSRTTTYSLANHIAIESGFITTPISARNSYNGPIVTTEPGPIIKSNGDLATGTPICIPVNLYSIITPYHISASIVPYYDRIDNQDNKVCVWTSFQFGSIIADRSLFYIYIMEESPYQNIQGIRYFAIGNT